MAATVAHEVRTPLSTLKMIGQRLKREFAVDEKDRTEYRDLLSLLDSETERVNRVVTEFLDMGRPLILARSSMELPELVASSLVPAMMRAEREKKILRQSPVPSGLVSVDRGRLHQIVQNIAWNALDAVEEGGEVHVTAEFSTGGFTVRVADNGSGMDPGMIENARRPFFTTKASGTGLGLPLAIRLVEAHGGALSISSKVGEGTVISAFFPGTAAGNGQKGES